jgi:hypothetical protein
LRVRLQAEEPGAVQSASYRSYPTEESCKECGIVLKKYHNKREKSQIFIDVAQEGVNHGNIYVM